MPIFTVVIFSVSQLGVLINYKNKSETLCRRYLLNTQILLEKKVSELLGLNPKAKLLRNKRRLSKIAYKNALRSRVPTAIAAAKAYDLKVYFLQKAFARKQNSINFHIRAIRERTKNSIKYKFKNNFKFLSNAKLTRSPRVPIYKLPLNSLTPSYHRYPMYSDRQQWDFKWSAQYNKILPSWIPIKNNIKMHNQCGASSIKKGTKWQAHLMKKDKFI